MGKVNMAKPVAVFCQDPASLRILKATLDKLHIEQSLCRSQHDAMELALAGNCFALIVDFDLPGAAEVARMASLLPQKPLLFSMTGSWPGTGQAFQSGAHRILYKPLEMTQMHDAFEDALHPLRKSLNKRSRAKKNRSTSNRSKGLSNKGLSDKGLSKYDRRKSPREQVKTLVYLEFASGTLPAIGVDLSEHGIAVHATEAVPLCGNVPFRCALPGAGHTLHGHAEVTWADEEGRAGMFFSRLSPEESKHLKYWLHRRGAHRKENYQASVRALLPTVGAVFAGG